MNMTFCLRDRTAIKPTAIYGFIHWSVDGRHHQWKLSTGESVPLRLWDQARRKAKKGSAEGAMVNTALARIESDIRRTFAELSALGQPLTPETVRSHYDILTGKVERPGERSLFDDYDLYITLNTTFTAYTKRNHRMCLNHLLAFRDSCDRKLSYDRFDVLTWERLVSHLQNTVKLTNPSVWNVCKSIKAFLADSFRKGHHQNDTHTRITRRRLLPPSDGPEKVYLTRDELRAVTALDLAENDRLRRVRDLFVFACMTGIRFGDLQSLRPENRQGESIRFTTGKNRKTILVPLLSESRDLWEQYEGRLPRISNQKGNIYLSEVLHMAGINTPVSIVAYRGTERIERTFPKWEVCGFHTAKRTFITLSRQLGISPEALRRATGNTLKTLDSYRLGTEEDAEAEIRRGWAGVR